MIKLKTLYRLLSVIALSFSTNILLAQSSTSFSTSFIIGIIAFVLLVMVIVVVTIADRLLKVSAQQVGADKSGANYSIFPKWSEVLGSGVPAYAQDKSVTRLKKGHDINLAGEATGNVTEAKTSTYAVKPTDFIGIAPIPKMMVAEKDEVKAGDALFFDKANPEIKFVSPVSGEVIEIRRGEKRRITEVIILADKDANAYKSIEAIDIEKASREQLVNFLAESGAWTFFRQRPYNVMASLTEVPRDIFVTTFDTAPLAPNSNVVVDGQGAAFQKGLDVLGKLTAGSVHLGLMAGDEAPSSVFTNATGVEKHWFAGKHPVGNVGVQIHHTSPINKGDIVWTIGVQEIITIGKLFTEGKYDASRVVALTGAEVSNPQYVRVAQGASLTDLLADQVSNENTRVISGDVLTGENVGSNGFLGFYDDQVTVVAEGDYYEAFGWLVPIKPRASISPTIPVGLYPDKLVADTNTHGEKRAFVVTGQYESVLPMDIYPQHLLKAILVNDFERMEGLGIYELVEEDLAICEFVCTSKQDIQAILRDGMNTMIEQG